MDARFGFIHDKFDIKLLTLFILARLPEPVTLETLSDITLLCDDGISYFDFAQCVAELVDNENILESDDKFSITQRGKDNSAVTETDIPYSVRMRAERAASALAHAQRRNSVIKASHGSRGKGGYTVTLSMSDGIGPVLSMELLAGEEKQAEIMENNFKKSAEKIYNELLALLLSKE